MASLKSSAVDRPSISQAGVGVITAQTGVFMLAAALALADTIDMVKLPADMVLDDLMVDCDDLDTGGAPAITLNVGLFDPTGATTNATAFTQTPLTIGQTGGMYRLAATTGAAAAAARRIAPVSYDRYIRITVAAGPQTGATTGKIKLSAFTRSKGFDD